MVGRLPVDFTATCGRCDVSALTGIPQELTVSCCDVLMPGTWVGRIYALVFVHEPQDRVKLLGKT